ncbi:laccase domain-containing protein [Arcanobacterium haemolyticum]|nr:laccase domain-containing protein [Arcanobacterium haemolyticum]
MSLVDWVSLTPYVRLGYTSRWGGLSQGEYGGLNLGFHVGDAPSAVEANRALIAAELGCDPAWMNQVHGATIRDAIPGAVCDGCDGLIVDLTEKQGDSSADAQIAAACVMVADCVPLLLASRTRPRGAAIHVGRAGMLAGIAEEAVSELVGRAVDHGELTREEALADLVAVIGPSICGKCYEVPDSMRAEAHERVPGCASETSWGTPAIDLQAGLRGQLKRAGVRNIRDLARCTYERDDYFSHRRSTARGSQAGRFVGIVQVATRPGSFDR